jgi:hypothetical protein
MAEIGDNGEKCKIFYHINGGILIDFISYQESCWVQCSKLNSMLVCFDHQKGSFLHSTLYTP